MICNWYLQRTIIMDTREEFFKKIKCVLYIFYTKIYTVCVFLLISIQTDSLKNDYAANYACAKSRCIAPIREEKYKIYIYFFLVPISNLLQKMILMHTLYCLNCLMELQYLLCTFIPFSPRNYRKLLNYIAIHFIVRNGNFMRRKKNV